MSSPPSLTLEQVHELNRKLAELRHNVNNHLALVVASVELIRRKPEVAVRLTESLIEQPRKISDEIRKFSDEFEKALGIEGQNNDSNDSPSAPAEVVP